MSFADEILVIDDFSTDKTKEIAESLGARVIQHGMNGDWGKQQTFAIKMPDMNGSYLLMRMSGFPSLWQRSLFSGRKGDKKAYWIRRENKFYHHHATHGVLRPDYVNRLFRQRDPM